MFNSKEMEWADLTLFFNGFRILKILDIQYTVDQEKDFEYGEGNEPRDIKRGNKTYRGTMTVLKGAADGMNMGVMAAGGESVLDGRFVVVADYKAKANRMRQTDSLLGLEFTSDPRGIAQNGKSMQVVLPFIFLSKKAI